MLLCALAGVMVLGCRAGGGEAVQPTPQETHQFIEAAEKRLETLGKKAGRAGWVQNTYITVDTQKIAADAQSDFAAAVTELALGARRFDGLQLSEDDARKLKLLKLQLSAPAPNNPAERDELSSLSSSLEGDYGKGKYCPSANRCLDINQASNILASSRDPRELLDVWQGWHRVGAPMRERYTRFVELSNKGARELGFDDTGVLWRSNYDMPPDKFAAEVDRLWGQVQPLYLALHTYVRSKLAAKYGSGVLPGNGTIPAHLVGNMWAQDWSNIYPLVAAPTSGESYDLTASLKRRNADERGMVKYAENFFTSLGYQALPPAFWERSLFKKPADRDVVCHASASSWDAPEDVRIKMCVQINGRRLQGCASRARPRLLRPAVCKATLLLSRWRNRRVPRSGRRHDCAFGNARILETDRPDRSRPVRKGGPRVSSEHRPRQGGVPAVRRRNRSVALESVLR